MRIEVKPGDFTFEGIPEVTPKIAGNIPCDFSWSAIGYAGRFFDREYGERFYPHTLLCKSVSMDSLYSYPYGEFPVIFIDDGIDEDEYFMLFTNSDGSKRFVYHDRYRED